MKVKQQSTAGVVDDIYDVICNSLTTPSFILSVFFSIAVVASHVADPTIGPLHWLLDRFSDHRVVTLINDEIHRFLGLLCFAPILINAPRVSFVPTVMSIIALVTIVPVQHQLVYASAAAFMHVYLHVRTRTARTFIVLAAVVAAVLVYAETRSRSPPPAVEPPASPVYKAQGSGRSRSEIPEVRRQSSSGP